MGQVLLWQLKTSPPLLEAWIEIQVDRPDTMIVHVASFVGGVD